MLRFSRFLLAGAGLLALVASTAVAADVAPAQAALQGTVDSVLAALTNTALNHDQRTAQIRAALLTRFDNTQMAKLVLGNKNWTKLDDKQQADFTASFTDIVFAAYSKRLDAYNGETVEFVKTDTDKQRATVFTLLVSKTGKLPVDYKMYQKKDGTWIVYDVDIDGVSLVSTYRKQYDDYLTTNPVAEFLEMVRAKVEDK